MGLEARLRQLESRIKLANNMPEHHFDFDNFVSRLGLKPIAVRELAQSEGCSLVEATCEMLGIEVRDFKH